MKKLIMIITILAACQGCVYTTVNTIGDEVKAKRVAFLYPFKTGGFDYNAKTGDLALRSYSTDGGQELAEKIAGEVTRQLIKGATP